MPFDISGRQLGHCLLFVVHATAVIFAVNNNRGVGRCMGGVYEDLSVLMFYCAVGGRQVAPLDPQKYLECFL